MIQDDSDDSSSSDDDIDTSAATEPKVKFVTPMHETSPLEGGTQYLISMPNCGGIGELSLSINNLCLIVEEQESDKKERYYFKVNFDKEIDEEKTKAKWKKKSNELQVRVYRA